MSISQCVHCAAISALLLMPGSSAIADPKANEIMAKAVALLRGYRTYQAEMLTSQTSPTGSFSMTSLWKIAPQNHKSSIRMTGNLFGDPVTNLIIDDGATLVMYSKARNTYTKGTHTDMTDVSPLRLVSRMLGDGNVNYVRSETLMGRKVHVLKKDPYRHLLPGATPKVMLYFDQATGRFVRMTMIGSVSVKPGAPLEKMELAVVVRNEAINAPISEGEFKFIPPPGAKEIQPGRMGRLPILPRPMGGANTGMIQ